MWIVTWRAHTQHRLCTRCSRARWVVFSPVLSLHPVTCEMESALWEPSTLQTINKAFEFSLATLIINIIFSAYRAWANSYFFLIFTFNFAITLHSVHSKSCRHCSLIMRNPTCRDGFTFAGKLWFVYSFPFPLCMLLLPLRFLPSLQKNNREIIINLSVSLWSLRVWLTMARVQCLQVSDDTECKVPFTPVNLDVDRKSHCI